MYNEQDLIDIVVAYAELNEWPCNHQPTSNTATVLVKTPFTTYTISCGLERSSGLVHLLCSFACTYPDQYTNRIRHLIELCTDELCRGTFVRTDLDTTRLISYKYGLLLDPITSPVDAIEELLTFMPQLCDIFYIAFQAVAAGVAPEIAFSEILAETVGIA